MSTDGPARSGPNARTDAPQEDLAAKIADLESRLEDALLLKREVESQAEIIRAVTRRAEDEWERAEWVTQHYEWAVAEITRLHVQLRALRSKLSYRAKARVYREVRSVLKRRSASPGGDRPTGADEIPAIPSAGPTSPSTDKEAPFEAESASDSGPSDGDG